MRYLFAMFMVFALHAPQLNAQDLKIATITRPPFSLVENGKDTGFSLDLWAALAEDLGVDYEIQRVTVFGDMLKLAENGDVDASVANISITASRETVMDFSQPIFESGLQIMVPATGASNYALIRAIFSKDLLVAIAAAFALLLGGGMLMWRVEHGRQEYFDLPARKAIFPAFWWALNLVVNGGFEERVPRSAFGRVFGVFLVISSLFIVSIFVARITAVITVDAIQSNVASFNDLYGKKVGTIEGSTASNYMEARDLRFIAYSDLEHLFQEFESGDLDAVVFDAPILAFYTNQSGGKAHLVGSVFLRENYGVALPSGSDLAEPLNQSLLKLRENGQYDRIYRKWFGSPTNG